MKVISIDRTTWKDKYEKHAYTSVFGREPDEKVSSSLFDAALVVVDDHECPIIYTTIKQTTEKSVFIEFGGSYPDYRGTTKVKPAFQELLGFLKNAGADMISLSTRNTNVPMQRLALSVGFLPWGMNFGSDGAFVDYALTFEGDK